MEAPKKLYLFENPIDGTPDYRWLSKRSCSDDVEYIRADAFIEKACEWLENHSDYLRVLDNGRCVRFDMTQCVSDFCKAMKEE